MRHARHRQDGGIAVDTPTIQRQRNVQVLEVIEPLSYNRRCLSLVRACSTTSLPLLLRATRWVSGGGA